MSLSHGGDLGRKHVCQVCTKAFQSVKAVHGHMRLHSGKKQMEVAESKDWEAEGFHSLRAKNTAKTLNNPFEPGSSSKSSGETLSPMRIEPSISLSSNKGSQSFLLDSIAYHMDMSDERIGAFTLLMMARGMTESDHHMNFPCNGNESKVKVESNISESVETYGHKQAYEVSENRSRPSNWVSDDEETVNGLCKHRPNGKIERQISSGESGTNLNLFYVDLNAKSSMEEEIQRKSKKPRRNSYKCRICSESFQSYQALGGHSIIHRDAKKKRVK